MSVTFDRLRFELPKECVRIVSPDAFSQTISRDGELTAMKYEQKIPFYYQILVNPAKEKVYVEFSGKALLEDYPSLISFSNFNDCIQNINQFEIVEMQPDTVMKYAKVCQCDVTVDVAYSGTVKDLYNSLIIANSRNYVVSMKTGNRFALQNTVATHRKRERLIVYDKAEEMERADNRPFLNYVKNAEEQKTYFSDKIRLELNLNSLDRIYKYLGISDKSLYHVLYAPADPIENFIRIALASQEDTLDILKHRTPKLRNLEHLLLICLCDFDQSKIEKIVRDTTGSRNSITATMRPFKDLLLAINRNEADPLSQVDFYQIQSTIKRMVDTYLANTDNPQENTLLNVYHNHQEKNQPKNYLYLF